MNEIRDWRRNREMWIRVLEKFTSTRAALFRFSDSRQAISPTLTSIWKHFGDLWPVGCGSAFVRQELLPSGFSCSRRLC
jgi:hypothetical protein